METLILHVDEDPQLPPGLAESLAREGYRIVRTADPEEAVRIVEERRPALVLMEIELAGCDGLDLMAGLRAPERGAVPVIVLTTAERGSGLHGEAIALGARDFVCKPARAPELLRAIRDTAPPAPPAPKAAAPASGPGVVGDVADAPDTAELSGSLADTPMPELLAHLRRRRASGVLSASRGSARVGVELRGGHPLFVTSGTHRAPRGDELRGLSEEEIQLEIGLRAEAALFQTFAWQEGQYHFSPDLRLAPGALAFARDGASLLLIGVLDVAPAARVRDRLGKCAALYVSSPDLPPAPLDGVELSAAQERILADLDGSEPLSMLLDAKALEERLLYGLWVAGRIELHAAPVITLSELYEESEAGEAADTGPGPPPTPAPQADAERTLEGQRWFQEGKGLLEAKRYHKAVEAFGMASHLDPGQGEYLAHLGYALFLSKPGQKLVRREAMEHVANGIKRSPDQEMSYVFLGRMLKATGDTGAATKLFRRALRVRPGCHPALQELRLLEMRKSKEGGKGKGLLARLLGR